MMRSPSTTRPVMVVVSHTHWDREWYLPFQAFRLKLVGMVSRLLDVLKADARYRCFMLDGQTVVLDDFAEAAPHRFPELVEHIRSGRILVGPWFVLPDEFLVSGEALIRNLMRGITIAEQYGQAMPIGYLPDSFGHIAEMPQILQGFGIDAAVLWRGVPGETKASEFIWESPDGSRVLTLWLVDSYSNAGGLPSDPEQLRVRLERIRQRLEPWATTRYLLLMNGGDHAWPQPELPTILDQAGAIFPDVEFTHGNLPDLIHAIRKDGHQGHHAAWPTVLGELRSGERAHLLPGVLSSRMWIKQRNFACQTLLERWAEPFAAIACHADSSAPALLPADVVHSLLDLAWRYLLLNHPHDSICGCSIDQVHDEMRLRFDWVEQIGSQIVEDSLRRIAATVETGAADDRASHAIVVFNAGSQRTDFVRHWIQADDDDLVLVDDEGHPCAYQVLDQQEAELLSATVSREELDRLFALVGAPSGDWTQQKIEALEAMVRALVADRFGDAAVTKLEVRPSKRPRTVQIVLAVAERRRADHAILAPVLREISRLVSHGDVDHFELRVSRRDAREIGFVACDVPSWGYRTYTLRAGHHQEPGTTTTPDHWIENERLIVQVDPDDGTFSIIDKETGAVFDGLHRFQDRGDAGDEYNFNPPAIDTIITRPAERPSIRLVEAGPVRWTLEVAFDLELPKGLAPDRRSRSVETVRCPVRFAVSLVRGIPRVEVQTTVINNAADHRLQVVFPTHLKTDHVTAESHFGVVERPLAVPADTRHWLEQPATTAPQRSFVDVSDGETGLLIANRGLPEYEAIAGPDGVTVALTLLRCVGWLSRDDLEVRRGHAGPPIPTPGAQCPGQHEFAYALVPHAGDWRTAFRQAHAFTTPLRAVTTDRHAGRLPAAASFVHVDPADVVVSAIRASGDGLVVRVLNQSPEAHVARVTVAGEPSRAELVNLREQPIGVDLPVEDGSVTLRLRPFQLATVQFSFRNVR